MDKFANRRAHTVGICRNSCREQRGSMLTIFCIISTSLLDVEIRELEARFFPLRTARNGLAPINQLPIEILINIFGFVADSEDKATGILRITWIA
ncbi:hypothetical protein BDN72DRAFT_75190 [Pluteus cervinus]|uniref:Uncharacterized protein n=1 Tax=Pluteus cervinus TaxID=181527 RepID=A0ACD3AQN5_9AGAR|nr:hypothetical protein BDN72DRAFT_75190 [Pluteus cervinus]